MSGPGGLTQGAAFRPALSTSITSASESSRKPSESSTPRGCQGGFEADERRILLWTRDGGRLPSGLEPCRDEDIRGSAPGAICLLPSRHPGANELAWPGEWTGPSPTETDRSLDPSPVQVRPLPCTVRWLGLLTLSVPVGSADANSSREGRRLVLVHRLGVVLEAKHLNAELKAARWLEREMGVAREIQVAVLPKEVPQAWGRLVSARCKCACELGEDFYGFFPLAASAEKGETPPPSWEVLIADLADKGDPADLCMAMSRTLLRGVAIRRVGSASSLARLDNLFFADTIEAGLQAHAEPMARPARAVRVRPAPPRGTMRETCSCPLSIPWTAPAGQAPPRSQRLRGCQADPHCHVV